MAQRSEHLRLALEALPAHGVLGKVLGQLLDRHVPVEHLVACAVDLAHPARAEQLLDHDDRRPRTLLGQGRGCGQEDDDDPCSANASEV